MTFVPPMVKLTLLCATMSLAGGHPASAQSVYEREFSEGKLKVSVTDWTLSRQRSARADLLERIDDDSFGKTVLGASKTIARTDGYNGAYTLRQVQTPGNSPLFSFLLACNRENFTRTLNFEGSASLFGANATAPMDFIRATSQSACEEERPRAPQNAQPQVSATSYFTDILSKVDRLWHIGQMVPTINGYIAEQKSIVSFKDGWATTRIDEVLTEGAPSSMRNRPGSWGRWKLNSKNELSVRWGSDEAYRDFYFAFSVPRATASTDFDGCFTKNRAADLSGIGETNVAVSVDTWCFAPDGRFTNDRTIGFSYGDGSVGTNGSSGSAISGTYSNDGYLLILRYDNGRVIETLAGISDEAPGQRDLLLGGSHFNELTK